MGQLKIRFSEQIDTPVYNRCLTLNSQFAKSGPRPAKSLFSIFGQNQPFAWISYIFINAALEPKIFVFKSSHQKQCRKAHNIGHFCQKDQTSISPRSKVRNRAKLTFQLAPKWQKVANGWILQIWLFSNPTKPTDN